MLEAICAGVVWVWDWEGCACHSLNLNCAFSVWQTGRPAGGLESVLLVSEPDPLWKGGRVWAHAHIWVVPMKCNYAWVISDWWQHHAYVHCWSVCCSPQVLGWKLEQHSDLPYLVVGNTESLEKKHFHDVICNHRFWLTRSMFRPGDKSNVGVRPDPSSSWKGFGSKTSELPSSMLIWRQLDAENDPEAT